MTKSNNTNGDVLARNAFRFNADSNGGEALILTTEFIANGDNITKKEGVYLNQELTLESYFNSASFNLSGAILTPALLRELADKLEETRNSLVEKSD